MAENAFGSVSPETLAAFDAVRAEVENDVVRLCLAEDAPQQPMGPDAEAMIRGGLGFVSRMLRAAMSFSAGEILADGMEWSKTCLPQFGVSNLMVRTNMERYTKALSDRLPRQTFNEIRPYVESMIVGPQGTVKPPDS